MNADDKKKEEQKDAINCRSGCGACCIAISISSPLPGMPGGKKAGERCVHLDDRGFCLIYNSKAYPLVCKNFKPSIEVCGKSRSHAFSILTELERRTR